MFDLMVTKPVQVLIDFISLFVMPCGLLTLCFFTEWSLFFFFKLININNYSYCQLNTYNVPELNGASYFKT